MTVSGLTEDEQRVMDAVIATWDEWQRIEDSIRPDEQAQVMQAINMIQTVLACRVVRRDYPDYWRAGSDGG